MNTAQAEIDRLDLAFQKLSGHHFKASGLMTGREYAWSNFVRSGYTVHDLEVTILWIKRGILNGKRFEAALGFRRLIADLMVWEDECSAAYAERRNSKPHVTPKERVIEQAGRALVSEPVAENTKHVAQLIENLKRSVGMID